MFTVVPLVLALQGRGWYTYTRHLINKNLSTDETEGPDSLLSSNMKVVVQQDRKSDTGWDS